MASYTWIGSTGAFDDPNNWDLATVPQSGDTAQFYRNGGTLSGTGAVGTLAFTAYAWVISGQLAADTASLDASSLTIDGTGQLTVSSALSVGQVSSAAMAVTNSARLAVTGGTATFGTATAYVTNRAVASLGGTAILGSNGVTSVVVDGGVFLVGSVLELGAAAGSSATITVADGGLAAVTAGANTNAMYLQVGGVTGASGSIVVSGTGSELVVSNNSGSIGYKGSGSLTVASGGEAVFNTSNNGQAPALLIGQFAGSSGVVEVNGAKSSLIASGTIQVGSIGSGTLRVLAGATVTSSAFAAGQAALSVASSSGSTGALVVDGAGTQLTANGAAVIGGDNRGVGLLAGGSGSVSLSNGGVLSTGTMTVTSTGQVSLDGASELVVNGDLVDAGTVSSAGTLSVAGTASGSGTLQIGGGVTTVGGLSSATLSFTSATGTLRVGTLTGTSVINGFRYGDTISLSAGATISGNVITEGSGTLVVNGLDPSTTIGISSSGAGVLVGQSPTTVDVYRFFDKNYGTHFFSSDPAEKSTISATRSDLVYEGVGLQAVSASANDPNAAPVYRFFDTAYGTHFFTASASERDSVIASRPDLTYEGVGFIEHTTQQAGDVAVYRFFDTNYGTHFYTADVSEKATIAATRSDLVYEGVGFYAPP